MIDVHLDPASEREFQRILQQLADTTDRPVEEVLRQQGRLLANDLAFRIKPLGFDAGKGKEFAKNIAAMVGRLYHNFAWAYHHVKETHGPRAAGTILRLLKSGQWDKAERLLNGDLRPRAGVGEIKVGNFDDGALHKQWRWRDRRRYPVLIVPDGDWQKVKRYASQQAKLAGFAKASLINAGRQLDGKTGGTARSKPKKWVTRHLDAPGMGSLTRRKGGFFGMIKSLVRYIREALPLAEEQKALEVRREAAEKQLQRIVDYKLRKAMARARRR